MSTGKDLDETQSHIWRSEFTFMQFHGVKVSHWPTANRLYPFDSELCSSAAKVYAQWRYAPEADASIDLGLKPEDGSTARKLLDLQALLNDPR